MSFFKIITHLYLRQVRFFSTNTAQIPSNKQSLYNRRILSLHGLITSQIKPRKDVLARSDVPKETWEELRNTIIKLGACNPQMVDTAVMKCCCDEDLVDIGINYYKFLEHSDHKPSVILDSKYLRLYGKKDYSINESEKKHILNVYKAMIDKFPILDNDTAESCIIGLCKIGEWKEAIEIIKRFQQYDSQFLREGYSALIDYFIKNSNIELAEEYLVHTYKVSAGPLKYVYDTYIQYCLKEKKTFNENIEKLFKLWVMYGIIPHLDTIKDLIDACNSVGWSGKNAVIQSSTCSVCKQKLSVLPLSEEEFKYLSKKLLQKVFVEKQYQVTDPKELQNFMRFIDKTKPYDIVVDGLNILYSNKWHQKYNIKPLVNIVTYFKEQNQKVLIIARKHAGRDMKKLQSKAIIFLVTNSSHDDPFLLYAALSSGSHTKVISDDFLRQYKYLLEDNKLRALFKRWQYTHQYVCTKNFSIQEMNLTRNAIGSNSSYINAGVQKNNTCWHIPFHHFEGDIGRADNVDYDSWVCLNMCPQHINR
ncbi:mitochondrial ribonuclease P catalytic subunit-like isoform X1 [Hylaeus volcanicus]|uniref:mitochondrial ribonuclease P catalytic subunit-like isoform X1 n=2 Tax=Hylaeus volcanicus TaxID=313075 RepID=UPI0023B864A9|nr:mitochondrial ribonuclease P catalytic subunit-like isoform X1 [Hylaeus volcanicus]